MVILNLIIFWISNSALSWNWHRQLQKFCFFFHTIHIVQWLIWNLIKNNWLGKFKNSAFFTGDHKCFGHLKWGLKMVLAWKAENNKFWSYHCIKCCAYWFVFYLCSCWIKRSRIYWLHYDKNNGRRKRKTQLCYTTDIMSRFYVLVPSNGALCGSCSVTTTWSNWLFGLHQALATVLIRPNLRARTRQDQYGSLPEVRASLGAP